MKQYRCIRDCYTKFGGRMHWQKDMIATVEDDVVAGQHFELVGVEQFRAPTQEEKALNTLSGIQKKQKELSEPKAGFAKSEKR